MHHIEDNPLGFIDQQVAKGARSFWVPGRQLCIADASLGRAVLRDTEKHYADGSSFFLGPRGQYPTRDHQIVIWSRVRDLLDAHLAKIDASNVVAQWPRRTNWPAFGNMMIFDTLKDIIVHAHRTKALHNAVRTIVTRRICPSRRGRFSWYGSYLRQQLRRSIAAERGRDPYTALAQHHDILSILYDHLTDDDSLDVIVAVYISFLFAIVGSMGLMLGWAILLAARHDGWDHDPTNVVTEALRLFPIAWMISRETTQPHELDAHSVGLEDRVAVCTYAIHRNPQHWDDPLSFDPKRWQNNIDRFAWLPFGAGANSCIATSLSIGFVSRIFEAMRSQSRWRVEELSTTPGLGPALKPNRFLLYSQH